MAELILYRNKLKHNFKRLKKLLKKHDVELSIVNKVLCGEKDFIKEVLELDIDQVCDSRISNLKISKEINPKVETIYIKPPSRNAISNVVQYADISLNTQYETIKLLSKEAIRQKKIHKIIIMIEMGDLREGVLTKNLISFYNRVFKLKGVKVIGLGTNLNCLHGVMPSADKLIQLGLYRQIIELKFNHKIKYLSGATTVCLPLIKTNEMPSEINHYRIGEGLFFGRDLVNNTVFPGFFPSIFELKADIIEIEKKPKVPSGELSTNPSGEVFEVKEEDRDRLSYRAIVDIGLLDVDPNFITPVDKSIEIIGASSDMIVCDLGDNPYGLMTGNTISFDMEYMGALTLLHSKYIEKVVV